MIDEMDEMNDIYYPDEIADKEYSCFLFAKEFDNTKLLCNATIRYLEAQQEYRKLLIQLLGMIIATSLTLAFVLSGMIWMFKFGIVAYGFLSVELILLCFLGKEFYYDTYDLQYQRDKLMFYLSKLSINISDLHNVFDEYVSVRKEMMKESNTYQTTLFDEYEDDDE